MPRYHPTVSKSPASLQRRSGISWPVVCLAIVVCAVLVALAAVLFGRAGNDALDANGNPLTPKTYGFAAGRP